MCLRNGRGGGRKLQNWRTDFRNAVRDWKTMHRRERRAYKQCLYLE